MCMFCAAIPVAGAVGAKLNADQQRRSKIVDTKNQLATNPGHQKKPVIIVTSGVICLLLIGSVVYHTSFFGN